MTPDRRIRHLTYAAVEALPTDTRGRPRSCRHVAMQGVGALCGLHPKRIACLDCFRRHARGHGTELEHTCDGCQALADPIHGTATSWYGQISSPTGNDVLVRVYVGGLGLCPSCLTEAQGVAA